MYKTSHLLSPLQSVFGSHYSPIQRAISVVKGMFASGEQGAWYDPSDLSTLFQDSAGTTPVTAVEQSVELMLDKRLGLVRGAELVINGSFDTSGVWLNQSTGTGTATISGGVATLTGVDASNRGKFYQAVTLEVGSTYELIYTVVSGTANSQITCNTLDKFGASVAGTYSIKFVASLAVVGVSFNVYGNGTVVFDNISIKKIAGNHATQETAINRPVLKQANGKYYLAFNGTNSRMLTTAGGGGTAGFFLCQAVKPTGGVGTVRKIFSDAGTNTGYRVRINASNQLELSAGNGTAYTSIATTATLPVGETHLITAWDDGTSLKVQIDAGTIASVARPTVSAGTAGFAIGAANGTAANWFVGNLYPSVYRQTAPTATKIASAQIYCKERAGI